MYCFRIPPANTEYHTRSSEHINLTVRPEALYTDAEIAQQETRRLQLEQDEADLIALLERERLKELDDARLAVVHWREVLTDCNRNLAIWRQRCLEAAGIPPEPKTPEWHFNCQYSLKWQMEVRRANWELGLTINVLEEMEGDELCRCNNCMPIYSGADGWDYCDNCGKKISGAFYGTPEPRINEPEQEFGEDAPF